jgi:hypothetical protein
LPSGHSLSTPLPAWSAGQGQLAGLRDLTDTTTRSTWSRDTSSSALPKPSGMSYFSPATLADAGLLAESGPHSPALPRVRQMSLELPSPRRR